MLDKLKRNIDYLRISVTDCCNLRCTYCMPEQGVIPKQPEEILGLEEIYYLAKCVATLGIKRIRLTGGEPLLRKGIESLVEQLGTIAGIYYALPGAKGTIGFISGMSNLFCAQCNRFRITVDGKLRSCLYSPHELDLKKALRPKINAEKIREIFYEAAMLKPVQHSMHTEGRQNQGRIMSQIGG